MGNNEIDELNSKEGIIKYKKSYVKEPLTHRTIMNKFKAQFKRKANKVMFFTRNRVKYLGPAGFQLEIIF